MRNVSLTAAFSIEECNRIAEMAEELGISKSSLIRASTMFVALLEPSLIGKLSILLEPELAAQIIKDAVDHAGSTITD